MPILLFIGICAADGPISIKERMIRMHYAPKSVSKTTGILLPIIVTLISGLIAPGSLSSIGFLIFGNLLRECAF